MWGRSGRAGRVHIRPAYVPRMAGMAMVGDRPRARTVAVERLGHGDHACLGFDGQDDRWALRAAFTTTGLALGERVMLFDPPCDRDKPARTGAAPFGTAREQGPAAREDGVDRALARLTAYGVPAREAAADGRLEVVLSIPGMDPARGFEPVVRPGYWEAAAGDALARGFTGLRAACDLSWACVKGVDAGDLLSYERELTPLFARIGFTAMCEYDRRLFPAATVDEAVTAHPLRVLPTPGVLHAEREGGVLRLAGHADLATRASFEWAVAESGLSVIDLTGLAFIDAYCVRALLRLSGGVVLECTARQRRLLVLCGLDQAEGVHARSR